MVVSSIPAAAGYKQSMFSLAGGDASCGRDGGALVPCATATVSMDAVANELSTGVTALMAASTAAMFDAPSLSAAVYELTTVFTTSAAALSLISASAALYELDALSLGASGDAKGAVGAVCTNSSSMFSASGATGAGRGIDPGSEHTSCA